MPLRSKSLAWLVCALAPLGAAQAQVVRDGRIQPDLPLEVGAGIDRLGRAADYLIGAELGEQSGPNLFHSFSSFSVGSGQIATFSGPDSVQHIVSATTGPDGSFLFGILRSDIPGADLTLLSPGGVVIGSGARLDVLGSVHISSAQELRFHGALEPAFPAHGSAPAALLSAAPPEAFGFDGPAGVISVGVVDPEGREALRVPAGETLSFVGGDVELTGLPSPFQGNLVSAPGARLQLASAAGPVEIPLDLGSFDPSGRADLGLVRITGNARIDVSGEAGQSAGGIVIRAGRFEAANARISANHHGASADAPALDISAAEKLILEGAQLTTSTDALGRGGDLRLRAPELRASAGTRVRVISSGEGASGDLRLHADALELSGAAALSSTNTASGAGGTIELAARELELGLEFAGGASVATETRGTGRGGDIEILGIGPERVAERVGIAGDASQGSRALISTSTLGRATGAGDAGRLQVQSRRVEISSGGQIFSRTDGSGDAGELRVDAAELVRLSGEAPNPLNPDLPFPSAILSRVETAASGNGGALFIATRELEVLDGAELSAISDGFGAPGRLEIDAADRISVRGSPDRIAQISTRVGVLAAPGPPLGGAASSGCIAQLCVRTGTLELLDGGQLTATTFGARDAGRIEIDADSVAIAGASGLDLSSILSQSRERGATGRGGDIALRLSGELRLGDRGRIQASSDSSGDAGNIRVEAPRLIATGSSAIATESAFTSGGNIEIHASKLFQLEDASITTSVQGQDQSSDAGNISIHAPGVAALNRGRIVAQAVRGTGGSIDLTAGDLLVSGDSVIDASSRLGVSGDVAVNAPETDLLGDLAKLQADFLTGSPLLTNACAARSAPAGSFAVVRREAPDPIPGQLLAGVSGELPAVAAAAGAAPVCVEEGGTPQ